MGLECVFKQFLTRLEWLCCFSVVTKWLLGMGREGLLLPGNFCFSPLWRLEDTLAAYHTCGPPLVVRLVIGPSGRAGLAWDTRKNGLRS